MEIISGPALSKMCDYSFGDHHSGMDKIIAQRTGFFSLIDGFMKEANNRNVEFLDKCKEFEGKVMTLYIDNLRLYNRPVEANPGPDTEWVESMLANNDLLALCGQLVDNLFIVFGHQEDVCIDKNIKIPKNVLGVYAVNAEYETDKLYPFPFGVQRQIGKDDNRQQILKDNIDAKQIEPTKLFYINCGVERNDERWPLLDFWTNEWCTTHFNKNSMYFPYTQYQIFLDTIKDHKFMACPRGHANCYDTHKIWETLYLRRIPVMRDYPYFRRLMRGFPVLFIKEWSDITEQMLKDNNLLYEEAQKMSLKKLDLNIIYTAIKQSYE